jgi:predicted ribosomally synthesized peptide with nif11-like leader
MTRSNLTVRKQGEHDMSIDRTTLNFLETLNRDPGMQKRMNAALAGAADPLQAAVAFAIGEGFAVTAESLDAAKKALDSNALSDSELESVAGGFNPQPEPPARTTSQQVTPPDYKQLSQLSNNVLRW